MESSIVDFHQDLYIPIIKKLEFHLPHVHVLATNHCGNTRREEFKLRSDFQHVLCRRDYAERVVSSFAYQIQYGYYGGNRSVSIEGIHLEYFSATDQEKSSSYSHSCTCHDVFHSFLSDNSKQGAATTGAHSKRIIGLLKNGKCLSAGVNTIWENIDGCAEHYRCATSLYL